MQRFAVGHSSHPGDGSVYGSASSNLAMFAKDMGGAGQHIMDMSRGNLDRRGAAQTWVNPYSNPEFEYVYLGSPQTSQDSQTPLILDPGMSSVSSGSQVLQPPTGNVHYNASYGRTSQSKYAVQPSSNFQGHLHPAQQFSAPPMHRHKAPEMHTPFSQEFYNVQDEIDMQSYEDIWRNLESDFLAQTSAQYDATPGDINMVDAVYNVSQSTPGIPFPVPNQTQPVSRPIADQKTWNMLSNSVQNEAESSSNVRTRYGNASSSTRHPFGFNPPRHFAEQAQPHQRSEVAQNRDLSFHQSVMETRPDFMDMVMDDSVSDGISITGSSDNQLRHAQSPNYGFGSHGYAGTASNFGERQHSAVQQSFQPENNSREQMQTNHQYNRFPEHREASFSSGGDLYNETKSGVESDFSTLMAPGQSGLRSLGESRWAEQLLNLCAAAIASKNISRMQHLMWVLNDLASVVGDANQRYAAYGLRALFCRITGRMEAAKTYLRPRHYDQEQSYGPKMVHRALVKFHEHVPWHQNCYSVASQTLLEVCAGKSRLHIIDIGAGKGIEWPIFIDALVSRSGGPPSILRMTMIRDLQREEPNLRTRGGSEAADFMTRLVKFASLLGLHVEVNMVRKPLECVTREDLKLRDGEILAVVCQFRLHRLSEELDYQSSPPDLSPRDKFLDFLFTLDPHIFIQSDNDSDHCSQDFLTRFQNAVSFWWRCFESIDVGYNGRDPDERQIIEYEGAMMLLNMVACEGIARIERNESYPQWARRIKRAGFMPRELSEETKKVSQNLVANHSEFWETVFIESNMVSLLWRKQPTTFTSVWKSSSCTNPKHSCKCSKLHN